MSLRQYLILTGIGAITSWLAFILVIIFIDPETTNFIGFSFFYLSLLTAAILTFALAGFLIRYLRKKTNPISWQVKNSFRQGLFFAILICASLWLIANNLFSWINVIALLLILTIFEFFLYKNNNLNNL